MPTATQNPRFDAPELTIRDIVHRLRYWTTVLKGIPVHADALELKVTLPTRKLQCEFYKALLHELRIARLDVESNPKQCPNGAFLVQIEGVNLLIANKEWKLG